MDAETGLYYYRARYYDAIVGRFISEDPISFAGGDVNLYRYVGNNPVDSIDPNGLASSELSTLLLIACGFQSGGTCEYQKSRNYSQAYSIAWGWFSVIVEQINEEPKVIPYGFSYYGSLVGGGTGNLRTGGGSGQIPTIDIKNHRTPRYANVGEIKFPFGDDGDCNPSLAPVPIPIPQNEENLEQQKSPASTPWWENLPSIPIIPIFEWLNPWKRTV